MKTERQLQAKAIRMFNEAGYFAVAVESKGVRGFPDVFLQARNRSILIEFKSPTGRGILSVHQVRTIEALERLGAEIYVVDSIGQVEELLQDLKRAKRNM